MQTWEAHKVEKAEQGNQTHHNLYHIIVLQSPQASMAVRGQKHFRKVGKQGGRGPLMMSYLFCVAG